MGLTRAARANDQELAAKIEQGRVVRGEAHEEGGYSVLSIP
jgi:hypothetical protein